MKNVCPHCGEEVVVYRGFVVAKPLELPSMEIKPLEPTVTDKWLEALEPHLPQLPEKLESILNKDAELKGDVE